MVRRYEGFEISTYMCCWELLPILSAYRVETYVELRSIVAAAVLLEKTVKKLDSRLTWFTTY